MTIGCGNPLALAAFFRSSKAFIVGKLLVLKTFCFSYITQTTSVFRILPMSSTELLKENLSKFPDRDDEDLIVTSSKGCQSSGPCFVRMSNIVSLFETSRNWKLLLDPDKLWKEAMIWTLQVLHPAILIGKKKR